MPPMINRNEGVAMVNNGAEGAGNVAHDAGPVCAMNQLMRWLDRY